MSRRTLVFLSLVFPSVVQGDEPPQRNAPVAKVVVEEPGLGDSEFAFSNHFGEPYEIEKLANGVQSIRYRSGTRRIYVEFRKNTAVQVYYFQTKPFSDAEIQSLLDTHAKGREWKPINAPLLNWQRSDGATSRQNKIRREDGTVEFMFAVLDG